jgi:hypothetical protein
MGWFVLIVLQAEIILALSLIHYEKPADKKKGKMMTRRRRKEGERFKVQVEPTPGRNFKIRK